MVLKTENTNALAIMKMEAYNSYQSENSAYKQVLNSGASEEIIEAVKMTVEHRLKMYRHWCNLLQEDINFAYKMAEIDSLEKQLKELYS